MGCCNGCSGKTDQKKKVTDDVAGIRRPIDTMDTDLPDTDLSDTAPLDSAVDPEAEETIRTAPADPRVKPKRV